MTAGDVVTLKSGGAPMTIWRVREDGILECCWHDKNGAPHRDAYAEIELKMATWMTTCSAFWGTNEPRL